MEYYESQVTLEPPRTFQPGEIYVNLWKVQIDLDKVDHVSAKCRLVYSGRHYSSLVRRMWVWYGGWGKFVIAHPGLPWWD